MNEKEELYTAEEMEKIYQDGINNGSIEHRKKINELLLEIKNLKEEISKLKQDMKE